MCNKLYCLERGGEISIKKMCVMASEGRQLHINSKVLKKKSCKCVGGCIFLKNVGEIGGGGGFFFKWRMERKERTIRNQTSSSAAKPLSSITRCHTTSAESSAVMISTDWPRREIGARQ